MNVEAELHERAVAASGLSDFGKDDYREGLRRFVAAWDDAPGCGGVNSDDEVRALAEALVVSLLVGRLRSEAGWRGRPDCLRSPIVGPFVITGIPRTGTTLLHLLLSMDERFQVVQAWLIDHPKPRPPRADWPTDPDHMEAAARAAAIPDSVRALHYADPDDADECLVLMAQSFVSNRFGSTTLIPSYDEWFLAQDMAPSFRRYADNLRLLGANEPEKAWLLKNPSHLLAMDEMLTVFPDAAVIQTHRRVIEATSSLVSLATRFKTFDTSLVVERQFKLWGEGVRRADVVRDRQPDAFHDVYYADLVVKPMDVIDGIYERFDLELTPGTRAAMHQWLDEHPQGRYGVHEYRSEDLGIDTTLVDRFFGDYVERYGLD